MSWPAEGTVNGATKGGNHGCGLAEGEAARRIPRGPPALGEALGPAHGPIAGARCAARRPGPRWAAWAPLLSAIAARAVTSFTSITTSHIDSSRPPETPSIHIIQAVAAPAHKSPLGSLAGEPVMTKALAGDLLAFRA
jgi:hypothetical protein